MSKSISGCFLLFIAIFCLCNNIQGQVTVLQDNNATANIDSVVATERKFYDEKNDTIRQPLLLKKYDWNIKAGQFEEANITLTRINLQLLPDSLKPEWYADRAFLDLYLSHYDNCILNTGQGLRLGSVKYMNRLLQFEILGYIMLMNVAEADTSFKQWAHNSKISADTINKYEKMLLTSAWKDPEKASRKARIIPGIGQWYAGGKRDAIVNSALLLLSVGGMALLIASGYILTPIISTGGLFIRFYTGGRRHAVALANKYNANTKEYLFDSFRLLFLRYHS